MSRGNYRQTIFPDDDHYAKFVRLLTRVSRRQRWVVLDWCLMPNHFHLVIQLVEDGLSDGMQELNGCYSRWSNARSGRTGTGHLVKNRFRDVRLKRDAHFWELMRYVPLNPVRAKLVEHPQDWRWSGYRAMIGLEHPQAFHQPAEALRFFAASPAVALRRYQQFVDDGRVHEGPDPWSDQLEASSRD